MQYDTEPNVRNWITGRRRLIGTVGVAIVALLGVLAIRWFVFGGLAMVPAEERSIEASWVDTIEKLGIEPRFPPEEDFVVGDLLALVTKDDENAGAENQIADPRTASFLRRSVKLAHIDVNNELTEEYGKLPVFPNADELVPPSPQDPGVGAPSARPASKMKRDFAAGVHIRDLPLAAFPRLRIQGTTSASAGISTTGFFASFGASDKEVEELELGEVRTYGLPSIRAVELLEQYCTGKNKNNCTEETARKHLKPATRDRSLLKYVINSNGDERYAMTVEVVMVYRVYVTRSIKNLRQASRAQQGGGRLNSADGQVETANTNTAPLPQTGDSDTDAMKRRIEELERQLAAVRNANAAVADAVYNRESSFEGTFDRPVAIGFRGIRVDWSSEAKKASQ